MDWGLLIVSESNTKLILISCANKEKGIRNNIRSVCFISVNEINRLHILKQTSKVKVINNLSVYIEYKKTLLH